MQPGEIVAGKYRLNRPLGTGGMAEVWSATNTFTERQVAIKFMTPEVAKTPEAAARFLNEAKVTARVNHPNIIDILDVGQTEQNQLFLVMELLTGFPLETALRRQTPAMTLYEFAIVMVEVADALAAAHRSGVVHRDLKPTNIYLHKLKEGVAIPKLLDFGVSKFIEEDKNHALTVAGTVLGSPLYMSPEQARGETHLDGRTDIFSFGAILFEALAGFRAYEAKNFNALIVKIATTKPRSIDEAAPEVPDSLRSLVRRCMEPDLKLRIGSFDEVIAMLRHAMPELEASPLRLPVPTPTTHGFDADATNALPVLRASDRPPAVEAMTTSGSIPPQALATSDIWGVNPAVSPSASSWQTPNTSYASINVPGPARRNPAWLVIAGAALVVGGIGIGAFVAARGRAPSVQARAPETALAMSETPTATPANNPPTVSVDALPGATKGSSLPKGLGRLSIASSPGSCAIAIDGKDRGTTPVSSLDLAAGAHHVVCRPAAGKLRSATVTVEDGATSKYRFALDD
jgi:serine/threonine-protein kinase